MGDLIKFMLISVVVIPISNLRCSETHLIKSSSKSIVLGFLPPPSKRYFFVVEIVSSIKGICLIHSIKELLGTSNSLAIDLIPLLGKLAFIFLYLSTKFFFQLMYIFFFLI